MLTGRNAQNLARTKTECMRVGARDRDVLELLGDITLESVQDELIGETIQQFGKLDILVSIVSLVMPLLNMVDILR
uniref:t-SNARE coiled-coil homology domain-containing protein n=1 Tax=Ascaris lumbricoides TaxID=6252 RepID=A0A0M3IX62_ASCLU